MYCTFYPEVNCIKESFISIAFKIFFTFQYYIGEMGRKLQDRNQNHTNKVESSSNQPTKLN